MYPLNFNESLWGEISWITQPHWQLESILLHRFTSFQSHMIYPVMFMALLKRNIYPQRSSPSRTRKKKTRFIMSVTFKEPIWDKMKWNHQAVKTVTLTPFPPAINMWSVSLLFSLDRETTCCNQNMINPLVYFLLSKLLDKTLYIKILAWWASHYQLIILWLRKLHPRNLQIQCRNRYWMRLRSCCPITGGRGL